MNARTTILLTFAVALTCASLPASAATSLQPRALGLLRMRQVPLLAQPESVGELLTQPEDERTQALRESGLDAAQIREVAEIQRASRDEVARRAAAREGDEEVAQRARRGKKAQRRTP